MSSVSAPRRDPLPYEQSSVLRLPALPKYRAEASLRRAAAFCAVPDYICGIRIRPLTPATFSMLHASGSRFIHGGSPGEGDVRNFLWFHSPLYCHRHAPFFRLRKAIALFPLRRQIAPLFARRARGRYFLVLLDAIAQIKAHVEEAFADSPPPAGKPGKPLATLEAFFIHEFASAYQWTPERTRATPLRQLVQLHRCIRQGRGETVTDAGEEDILFRHIQEKNAALAQHRQPADPATN